MSWGSIPMRPEAMPIAFVYKGPAACAGCAESVVTALDNMANINWDIRYIGQGATTALNNSNLAPATLYCQPGGGSDVESDYTNYLSGVDMQGWVSAGGRYIGTCAGAYLMDPGFGFGLIPGNAWTYAGLPGALLANGNEQLVSTVWAGVGTRKMYAQDPNYFTEPNRITGSVVLATYPDTLNRIAAMTLPYGSNGRVGGVGPHPEADASWYTPSMLAGDTDGFDADLFELLVNDVMRPR